jgi:hypothetical protein
MTSKIAIAAALFVLTPHVRSGRAQTTLSPEEARMIEFGKEIYKVKVNCQYCHKWDGSEVDGRRGDSGGRCRCPSGWPS